MSGKRSGRSRSAPPTGMAGVTLIELLVTLSIAVIVMTVAVPGFSSLIAETRRVTAVNELVGALNMARSEAIKRGVRVTLCKTSTPNATSPSCELSAGWNEGWVLFQDNTHLLGNQLGVIDGEDTVIQVFQPATNLAVSTGGNYAGGAYYDPNGLSGGIRLNGSRASFRNDTFVMESGGRKSCVVVSRIGRVATRKQGERSCN